MRIIQLPRVAGKTYQLITISAERGAYIVCRDIDAVDRIVQRAEGRKLDIPYPITFEEFANKRYYGKGIREMLIDDIDQLLIYLAGVNVSYATYTPT